MLVTGNSLHLPLTLLGWPLLATLVSVGAVTIGLVALPYHDIMVELEYWWECLVLQCNVWAVMSAMLYATNTPAIMNQDRLYVWWKNFGITYKKQYSQRHSLPSRTWQAMSLATLFIGSLRPCSGCTSWASDTLFHWEASSTRSQA